MSKKWLINLSEEPGIIKAHLIMEGAKNKFLFGVRLFLVYQTIRKSRKYVKYKSVLNQDVFHIHSSMNDGDSGIC